jgi:hypothetical protein
LQAVAAEKAKGLMIYKGEGLNRQPIRERRSDFFDSKSHPQGSEANGEDTRLDLNQITLKLKEIVQVDYLFYRYAAFKCFVLFSTHLEKK